MPISLLCGACDAALTAPDAAAGKRVKCRKCGAILEVPLPEPEAEADFEVVEEAPTMMMPPIKKAPPPPVSAKAPPPAAKPKPKPMMLEVDDDEDDRPAPKKKPKPAMRDDDEDDDRPAPKKPAKKLAIVEDDFDDDEDYDEPRAKKGKKGKAKKKAGTNLPLLVGGGVLGVAVAGFLVYWFVIREPQLALVTPPPVPQNSGVIGGNGPPPMPGMPGMPGPGMPGQPAVGWQEFKKSEFTAMVNAAGQPRTQSLPVGPGIRSGTAYAFETQNPNGVQIVTVVNLDQLGTTAAQQDPNKMLESIFTGGANKGGGAITARSDSRLDGKPARDATIRTNGKTMFLRGAIVGNRVYMLLAGGDGVNSAQDAQAKSFFDSFKIAGQ